MQRTNRWMVVVWIIASLQLVACTQKSVVASKVEAARVEPIEETDLNLVVLTELAAKRLAIQTAPVQEQQVMRMRTVGGEVMTVPAAPAQGRSATATDTAPADASKILVRVALSEGDLNQVDRGLPVRILPLVRVEGETGVLAELVEAPAVDEASASMLYYALAGADHDVVPGQRVRVELTLAGSGTLRTVIPYGAVIYDLDGGTWAYTSPEPLTFVRASITVDYIAGDLAVLTEGPATGTEVVTAGAAELYGTEFGVGH